MIKLLKPIYDRNGTLTVGNTAQIGDGACAIVLASEASVKSHRLLPLAKIIGYATTATGPTNFCLSNC